MKRTRKIILGIILIAAGVIFALNALEIAQINIFFDGWWTLFIIVPCLIGLFTEREKMGNAIGLAIGVVLLLCARGIMEYDMLWKMVFPAIIIVIGIKLILVGAFDKKTRDISDEAKISGGSCAVFSGSDVNYGGKAFEGTTLTAVFGGIDCDLKDAIIEKDCIIRVCAVFGGIDIYVPEGVNVKANSTDIFGGVSNETKAYSGAPTIYITGACVFGGVDIK